MGTSSSKNSGRPTIRLNAFGSSNKPDSVHKSWRNEAYVEQLIRQKILAVKTESSSPESGDECTICMVDCSQLNKTICCGQEICTSCYVDLKIDHEKKTIKEEEMRSSNTSSSFSLSCQSCCPYCESEDFKVICSPIKQRPSLREEFLHPNKSVEEKIGERPSTSRSTSCASTASNTVSYVSSVYITPEQEKKLRSMTMDSESSTTSSACSKADRQKIEMEILRIRQAFADDIIEVLPPAPSVRQSSGDEQLIFGRTRESITQDIHRLIAERASVSSSGDMSFAEPSIEQQESDDALTLQNLLQSLTDNENGSNAATYQQDLCQLEDIMLTEAIKLSLSSDDCAYATDVANETAAAETSSNTNTEIDTDDV